jgi:hypothetical protein
MSGVETEIASPSCAQAARRASESAAMWSELPALMVYRIIKDSRSRELVRCPTRVDELWIRLHRDVGLLPFPKTGKGPGVEFRGLVVRA